MVIAGAEMVIEWLHRVRWHPLLQQGPNGPEESPGMDGANWQLSAVVRSSGTHCPWGSFSVFNQVQDPGTPSQQQGLPACTQGHAGRAPCEPLMTLKTPP